MSYQQINEIMSLKNNKLTNDESKSLKKWRNVSESATASFSPNQPPSPTSSVRLRPYSLKNEDTINNSERKKKQKKLPESTHRHFLLTPLD